MKKKIENKKNHSMKDAYVEQVIIWMFLFVAFTSLLFFSINYSTIIRVQDNMNSLSDYGARRVSVNGSGVDIIADLNNMRHGSIKAIIASDLVCTPVTDNLSKVIFITETVDTSFQFVNEKLVSRKAVFNEVNSNTVTCTLTIDLVE